MARLRNAPRHRHGVKVALLSALVVPMSLLGACGNDDGGSDGKVTLRFSWWGSDTRHAMTQKLIDLYQSKNPNVKIQPEYTDWNGYWDRMATSVAGGNAPDVMQQETKYVREYADRGALLDLTSQLQRTIKAADLDPLVKDAGAIDGKTYAIPTGVNALALVASPSGFEAAKVGLPDDSSWTWDDYVKVATDVTKGSPKGSYGTQNMGYSDASLEVFARQRGESTFTGTGMGVSKQTLVDWWTISEKLRKEGGEPPASLSVETQASGLDGSLIGTGKGAMGFWWTNELPAISEALGKEVKLLRVPGEAAASTPGMFLKPARFWSISSKTKHPEEAAKFVDFLLNDPAAAEIILSDRGLPVNLTARKAIVSKLTPADQLSAQFMDSVREKVAPPPALPPKGAGEVQKILQQINEQVLFAKLTPEQAADEFLKQAAAAIG